VTGHPPERRNSHVSNGPGCHSHGSRPTLEQAFKCLTDAGLKLTKPRCALMTAIAQFEQPFSAEELFAAAAARSGAAKAVRCDLVTVYRSLLTFTALKLVSKVDLGDGVGRYELSNFDGSHHHHVICSLCRRVEALKDCSMQRQEKVISGMGYTDVSHRLEFIGLCPSCQDSPSPTR
jgi:Fur family ferric uptake transcriptional regulator